jgi:uracil-DNA glycosylase family 4
MRERTNKRTPPSPGRGAATPDLEDIARAVVACERCPRLRRYCQEIAAVKRRAFRDWTYWGRPVPGFGDPRARLWIVGLAPAAHGANRTGRMFTGDSSGDWLYRALHDNRFAVLPTSESRDDGQELRGVYISAVARCAPPDNKPATGEIAHCAPYLTQELAALPDVRIIVPLGSIAFDAVLRLMASSGAIISRPRPRFAHRAHYDLPVGHCVRTILASYHPSRQNTQTGRLTRPMFDAVFRTARELLTEGP